MKMAWLSCHRFRANEARLWLSLITYNLGNLWRRLVLPGRINNLVADQFAAAAGEDRLTVDRALPSILFHRQYRWVRAGTRSNFLQIIFLQLSHTRVLLVQVFAIVSHQHPVPATAHSLWRWVSVAEFKAQDI